MFSLPYPETEGEKEDADAQQEGGFGQFFPIPWRMEDKYCRSAAEGGAQDEKDGVMQPRRSAAEGKADQAEQPRDG